METVKPLRTDVLGIPVDCIDMAGAVNYAKSLIEEGQKGRYILAVNPEKVMALLKNDDLRQTFSSASLLIPDGIGVVLALRLLQGARTTRVPGAELMPRLCAMATENGYGIFLLGSREEVNQGAAERLCQMYPGLKIAGRANGYFKDQDIPDLIRRINASGAKILFVALGSPKQEQWIQKWSSELSVNVLQGIGGTLDTIEGSVQRAPAIFCKFGLEWFYRLVTDPKRMRRQSVLPVFAWKVVREKLKRK